MQIKKRYFALALVAAMLVGGTATGALLRLTTPALAQESGSDLTKVEQVYNILQGRYYTQVDHAKAVDGAISGMVGALGDPYTTYMSPAETKSFTENISSSFDGIGATIEEQNGHIVVASPIKGSPAEKAGIKPQDIILQVNGLSLDGMTADEAVTHIRGPKGTEAKLLIQRLGNDTPFTVSVIRDKIPLETVSSEMLDGQTGIIRISQVSERTSTEFGQALADLKSKGAKGIVLDLRQNPGGLLSEAIKIAENFVPKGKLILQEKYRDGSVEEHRSQGHASDLPFVVLVDKGSASAAEIISGALRESAGIPLVGDTTFGKGLVQTTTQWPDGSSLKYTMAQWLTPDGHQINKTGLTPDYPVKLPDYADLPFPNVDKDKEYKQGDQAEVLKTVQKMLKALGYDPGRNDGLIDAGTAQAVKAFQAANGLPQTGTVNQTTTLKAVSLLQKKIQENDTQLAKAKEVLAGLMKK